MPILEVVLRLLKSPDPACVAEAERLCGVRVRRLPYCPPPWVAARERRTPRIVRIHIPEVPPRIGRGARRGTLRADTLARLRATRVGTPITLLSWTPRQVRHAVRAGWLEVA